MESDFFVITRELDLLSALLRNTWVDSGQVWKKNGKLGNTLVPIFLQGGFSLPPAL